MSAKPGYVIGVDGGGTGCRVRLSDASGRVLGEARSGPANLCSDFDRAMANVLDGVARAYAAAGLDPAQRRNDTAWLGLAGAGVRELARRMEAALEDGLGFARARVSTDSETTAQGVLGDADGVLALIGTGSFFLRRQAGHDRRIGGWGYQLGDEAGGAWLGRAALRATLLAHDGLRQPSALTRALMARHGGRPDEIARFAASASPGDIAALAPEIAAARDSGDPVARAIFDRAVRLICERLDFLGAEAAGKLCLAGGLAGTYAPLLPERLAALLHPPLGDALDGATALARALQAQPRLRAGA